MLIAIAVLCAVCEAIFTAMEVALGALSRARLRALDEEEREEFAARAHDEPAHAAPHAAPSAAPAAPAAVHAEAGGAKQGKPFVRRRRSASGLSRPARLLALLDKPERLTLAFITVTSLSLWTASALLSWLALRDGWNIGSLVLALAGLLFFAEALPLVVAARNPEAIALRCVGLIEKSTNLLAPLSSVLGAIGTAAARILGARGVGKSQAVTAGELRHALDQAEHEGVIEPEERAMLEGAMDFRGKTVREVMTPRIDMVAVPQAMPLRAVLDVAMQQGRSRLPVYNGSTDHIVGIVAAKDLLPHLRPRPDGSAPAPTSSSSSSPLTAGDVARPAFFLPVAKRVDAAIDELRRQRMLMAIVVEPDGGTAGLVTLEDLLEEIVGEIEDEYDEDEAPLRLLADEPLDGDSPRAGAQGSARGIVAEASVSVRQAERFWRRHFKESLVLFEGAEPSAADEALSLAALAQRLLDGVPREGERTRAGALFPAGTARQEAEARATIGAVEIEIARASGPRLEEVRLVRAEASVSGH